MWSWIAFISQLFRLGIRSLLVHKLRSALTVLGMVFGVASVVSILAIGEGASQEVQEQLRELGPDRILLRSVYPPNAIGRGKAAFEYGLTHSDLRKIESLVPGVQALAPSYELDKNVHVGPRMARPFLVCTTPAFQRIHRLKVARGRFLSDVDLESRANVAVIGAEIARTLFGPHDPLGRELKLGSGRYRIVGVLRPQDNAGSTMNDPNDSLFLPLSTGRLRLEDVIRIVSGASRTYERVEVHQIGLLIGDLSHVEQVASMIRRILQESHAVEDYEVTVPLELLRQAERTKRVFSMVLGCIGGISLLVGGIGIMNIMLATVTERTREIGIRRAIGAKRWHITLQFLVETVVLSFCGGVLGLALGLIIPQIITQLSAIRTVVTPTSLMLALGISVLVGILFGIYPARRAASMDPNDALRYA